jgi:hypothetical protein
MLAVAHHGHGVAKAENFVHAMRHVQYGRPVLAQSSDQRFQPLRLHRRKRAGRLVHHQNTRPGGQRGGDLHHLRLAGAQRPNSSRTSHSAPISSRHAWAFSCSFGASPSVRRDWAMGQADIFSHAEIGDRTTIPDEQSPRRRAGHPAGNETAAPLRQFPNPFIRPVNASQNFAQVLLPAPFSPMSAWQLPASRQNSHPEAPRFQEIVC